MRRSILLVMLFAVWHDGSAQWQCSTKKDACLLLGGGMMTAIGYSLSTRSFALDPAHNGLFRLHPLDRWAIRPPNTRWDRMSRGTLFLSGLGLPILFFSDKPENRPAYLLMGIEAVLWTMGITEIIKRQVARPRPYVYHIDFHTPYSTDDYHSFISGHTSMAFLFAVMTGRMYQTRHPDSKSIPWVWAGLLGCATFTGVMRVAAGQHFPTDVLGGAVVGSFIGWAIPELHKMRSSHKTPMILRVGVL